MGSDNTGQTLSGVERAFKIVRQLKKHGPMTVTDLATALDLPKSTAHIYLKTMKESGYLYQDGDTYHLSLHFLEHGATVRREFDIYDVAKEEVDELAEQTGEVANIGVEEAGQRVLLYKMEGGDALYDNAHTGEFIMMHWTSLGKALLAHLPPERIDEIVDGHSLPAATEHTITDRDILHDELDRIRKQGYAIEDEEHHDHIRAVAVPILVDGTLHAALSISGPKSRFSDDRIDEVLLEALQDKVNVIQLRLEHY